MRLRSTVTALPVAALAVLASGTTTSALSHAGAVSSHPRIAAAVPADHTRNFGWASSNWSGYAITGGTGAFNAVTGSWKVPAVSATRKATYSSDWVGIDGFNNSDLIQTGTESDYVNGAARYDAWWEILPAAETVISSISVHPGDSMSASVTKGSGGSWTISISDGTTGRSFTTTQTYSGPQTSAEWIEEAPTVGGHVATLAHYGQATFDPGTVNGGNPRLAFSDSGDMVQGRSQVSTPSVPDGDTDGFNVAYGSTQPSPPTS
jgi:hypothetical protein